MFPWQLVHQSSTEAHNNVLLYYTRDTFNSVVPFSFISPSSILYITEQ